MVFLDADLPFDKLRTSAGLPFDFARRRCRFTLVVKSFCHGEHRGKSKIIQPEISQIKAKKVCKKA